MSSENEITNKHNTNSFIIFYFNLSAVIITLPKLLILEMMYEKYMEQFLPHIRDF